MMSTNGTPWITHRIQHPTAKDIIVRDSGLPIPAAVTEIIEPYAIAFHAAASDHRRQASIVDTLLNLLLRQHWYRFIIPVGRVYRLPETPADWIDVRRKLAASLAAIRIASVIRSTDLVVSSWDDANVAVTKPHSNAVLHKIVSIYGEEVTTATAETRAEVLRRIAVEVEARFGCRFLLPRRCGSNSTVVYRILDPQCEHAQHFLSQSLTDWPPAVATQIDDTLLMLDPSTRAFMVARDIQTTDALLRASTEDVVRDLLDWRHEKNLKEWKTSTAKIYVNRWKRMAAKHQRNVDGRSELDFLTYQRQPKVEVDLSSILLDQTARAFLTTQGITRSSDLFRGSAEDMGQAFIDWRHQHNLADITASDAKQYVYSWRRCVVNHVPEESNADASRISNLVDARLSSRPTGNFARVPSQGRPLAGRNDTSRISDRADAGLSSRPIGNFVRVPSQGRPLVGRNDTSRISDRADAGLSSRPTGNFFRVPSQGRPLVGRNNTARAVHPAVALQWNDTARLVRPTTRVLDMQGGDTWVRDERNTEEMGPSLGIHAGREWMVATGQFASSIRIPTTEVPPALNALDSAIHTRSYVEADRERMVATGRFSALARIPTTILHPALNAFDSAPPNRSFVESDRADMVAIEQFASSARMPITEVPPASNALDSAMHERSFAEADQERTVATCQFAALTRIPTTIVPPVWNALDSAAHKTYPTSTSSTTASESATTPAYQKATLTATAGNGETASIPSSKAADDDMSASVSTLAVEPGTASMPTPVTQAVSASTGPPTPQADPVLAILGATALSFLSTQGILTASDFCRQSTEELSQALSNWRQRKGMKTLLAGSVERYVQMWKQSVRREMVTAEPRDRPADADDAASQDDVDSEVDIATSEDGFDQRENVLPRDGGGGQVVQTCASGQAAPSGQTPLVTLDPALCFLNSLAQAFLTFQGLITTRVFVEGSTKGMALELVEYRRHKNLREWTLNTAERHVSRWKHEVQERQPSEEERPVDVDPSFEVFSPTVRSFLAAQSIANPSDFFLRSTQQLSEALVAWRRGRNMKELKLRTAEQYVQRWRRSVAVGQMLPTSTGVAPPVSGIETSPDTNLHQGRSPLSPLRERENSARRLFFGGATDGPKVHRSISGTTDNGAVGGCENGNDNGKHELEIDRALDILDAPAKDFLASRGITTAQSLLQGTSEALAHALVAYRRQQKSKEWTFSTAQRYVWNWKHRVKDQLSLDGGSAKTRPTGRPPLSCDWDVTRGVWVPRSHTVTNSKPVRRPAVNVAKRALVVDQSSFTAASGRKVTFQDDVHAERFEEDNAEEDYRASAKLNDSKDGGERQVRRKSGKLSRKVATRTWLTPRNVTDATVGEQQDTGTVGTTTNDADLDTGTEQIHGKDSNAYRQGTSCKRSRSESNPNALERSPKRGWQVVASSCTSLPK
jgi:hypothetical protein